MTRTPAEAAAPTGAVGDALHSVALFVPRFVAFLAILVVGWLVARLLRTALGRLLHRIGFDRWVERGGVKAALARSKYDATDVVARLVYYAVLLFALQLAFGVWGPNPVSDLIRGIVAWLPRAFVAIVIVVVATAIASAVRDIIGNALGALSYGRLLAGLAAWFIIGLGVIAALNQIGVATTVTTPVLIAVLATVAGILVVGVGGGLVRPMQQRWDGWLERAGEESEAIAERARAYRAARADAPAAAVAAPVGEPAPGSFAPVGEPAATGAVSTGPDAVDTAALPDPPQPAATPQPPADPRRWTPSGRPDGPAVSRQVPSERPVPTYAPGTASPGGATPTAVFPKQPAAPDDNPTAVMPPVAPDGPGEDHR